MVEMTFLKYLQTLKALDVRFEFILFVTTTNANKWLLKTTEKNNHYAMAATEWLERDR